MKKTLLLTLALLFSTTIFAQLIDERFDSAELPEGWSIMGDAEKNWSISNTNNAGGEANEARLFWSPQFSGVTRLVTKAVDLTDVEGVYINFSHYFENYDQNYKAKLGIATSSDNGATWNEGWTQEYNIPSSLAGIYHVEERMVTADMGKENVMFCIFFDGTSFNFTQWCFDNIVIKAQSNSEARLNSIDIYDKIGSGPLDVKFSLQNMGNNNIQSFEASYELEGYETVTETFSASIASFETASFTFSDKKNLLPGTYNIKISILNVNGGEDNLNDNVLSKEFNASLGEKQRIPMIEHFSSSTCSPCVLINSLMLKLTENNPGKYTYTKYVVNFPGVGDPYYTAECGIRHDYYQAYSAPRVHLDSELQLSGNTAQPVTQTKLLQRYDVPAFAEIRGAFDVNPEDNTISIIADVASYVNLKDVRTFISVNEKTTTGNNLQYTEETEWHHVMMKMIDGGHGIETTIKAGEYKRFEYTYDMGSTFMEDINDLEVAVWVQDYATKEIFNSHYLYEYTNHPYPVENLQITEGNRLKITWDKPENAEPLGYNLYINNELTLSNTQEKSFSVDKSDFYVVEVVALYENAMTSVGTVNIYSSEFSVPQNLTVTDNTSNIVVSWDAVEGAIGYEVYRNKKYYASVESTSFTDIDFLKGDQCCYQVKAVFKNNKSALTKEECVTATGDMLEELNSRLEIYPNPVNDMLFIDADFGINEVVIYDVYGRQQVTETPSHQDMTSVNVSGLNAGIYFVKINTNQGEIVKRFIKR
ncbi:MAG: T9SS type A sorting domain-containing protein [Bacteroidales bacterium]|nr:T9SS type A sorting domain-containing protein [Bacteroidales bacterium]